MKRATLMFGVGALALALTGCGTFAGHGCGACCKGVGISENAALAWGAGK